MSDEPFSKLYKRTIALHKQLSPTSKFHGEGSVSKLQHAVLEVGAVLDKLDNIKGSIEKKGRIKERWDRGSKWILEKQESGVKGTKVVKPEPVPV